MTTLFSSNTIKIYLLLGGVGVALAMLIAPAGALFDNEALYNAGAITSYWWNVSLFCTGAVHFALIAIKASPKTTDKLMLRFKQLAPSLPAGSHAMPDLSELWDISPDIVIASMEGETKEETAKRYLAALNTKNRIGWIVCLVCGESEGIIVKTAPGGLSPGIIEVKRQAPPWQAADCFDEDRIDPQGTDYARETYQQFRASVTRFLIAFRRWVVGAKVERADEGQKALVFAESLIRCAVLVLLSVVSVSAQKSAQLTEYLGGNPIPKRGHLEIQFQQVGLERTADGIKSYTDILRTKPGYSDDSNAGEIVSVKLNGQLIPRAEKPDPQPSAKLVNQIPQYDMRNPAAMIRPHRRDTSSIPRATGFESLAADSSTIANNMNAATQKVERWKQAGWAAIKPVWRFFMYLFASFFGLLLCAGGLCWYIADSATDETYIGYHGQTYTGKLARSAHEAAAGWLLLICWICFTVLLINVFLWLVYAGMDMWLVVVLWFIALGISSRVTKKIVPNIKRLGGKGTGMQPA